MDIHVKINEGRRLVDVPTSTGDFFTRIESPLFLVLLRRRLRHTLPLSKCICGCGHSTNTLGHHRTACSRTRECLEEEDLLWKIAAARVCSEAGGRVASTLFRHNMDLGLPSAGDSRRLEVVVDGLHPLWRCAVGQTVQSDPRKWTRDQQRPPDLRRFGRGGRVANGL